MIRTWGMSRSSSGLDRRALPAGGMGDPAASEGGTLCGGFADSKRRLTLQPFGMSGWSLAAKSEEQGYRRST